MGENWYVFFVKSGQEVQAAKEINAYFKDEVQTRILLAETLFRKNGVVKKEKKVVFLGYVFVLSRLVNETFIIRCKNLIIHSAVLIRILCYGDTCQAALYEKDVTMLKKIWPEQNCLEVSVGIMEGDRVRIVEGPFVGKESIIRKINRHKRQAVVEVAFMGENRLFTVGLDIIKKNDDE